MFIIPFALVTCEFIYSIYKRDGIYNSGGTASNILNGLIIKLISLRVFALYLAYYVVWHLSRYSLLKAIPVNPLSFVACFLLVDFSYYVFHYVHHRFEFFWMFHSVHHSDTEFNLSTSWRLSWIEQIYIFFFFTPIMFLGFSPLEVLVAYGYLSFYQFFVHDHYFNMPRFLDYILVTPNNHSIHHDQVVRNQTSNFGGVLSIWDHAFNTYTPSIASFTPGIEGYHEESILKIQVDPIVSYIKRRLSKRNART